MRFGGMKKYLALFLIMGAIVSSGCSKSPDSPENPLLRIGYDKKDSVKPFRLALEYGVRNDNDSIVFEGYSADLALVVNGKELYQGKTVSADIMPFTFERVRTDSSLTREEFERIAGPLNVNIQMVEARGMIPPVYLGDDQVVLKKITYSNKKLTDLLRGTKK
jgi:hypothetical protein